VDQEAVDLRPAHQQHFTLKTNPLKREDLDEFVRLYNPANRHDRPPEPSTTPHSPGTPGGAANYCFDSCSWPSDDVMKPFLFKIAADLLQ
jgi:hypothetical protein